MMTIVFIAIGFFIGFALGAQVVRARYDRQIRMLEAIQSGMLASYGAKMVHDLGLEISKKSPSKEEEDT